MPNVIIEGAIQHRTERALKLEVEGVSHWIPLSKISPLSMEQFDEYFADGHCRYEDWSPELGPKPTVISIPEWLAKKNDLI